MALGDKTLIKQVLRLFLAIFQISTNLKFCINVLFVKFLRCLIPIHIEKVHTQVRTGGIDLDVEMTDKINRVRNGRLTCPKGTCC